MLVKQISQVWGKSQVHKKKSQVAIASMVAQEMCNRKYGLTYLRFFSRVLAIVFPCDVVHGIHPQEVAHGILPQQVVHGVHPQLSYPLDVYTVMYPLDGSHDAVGYILWGYPVDDNSVVHGMYFWCSPQHVPHGIYFVCCPRDVVDVVHRT